MDEIIVTNPSLESLLEMAKNEQVRRRPMEEYYDIIVELRKKGFTYRHIVIWLSDHGCGSFAAGSLSKILREGGEE